MLNTLGTNVVHSYMYAVKLDGDGRATVSLAWLVYTIFSGVHPARKQQSRVRLSKQVKVANFNNVTKVVLQIKLQLPSYQALTSF